MTLDMSVLSPSNNYFTEAQWILIICTAKESINKLGKLSSALELNRDSQINTPKDTWVIFLPTVSIQIFISSM